MEENNNLEKQFKESFKDLEVGPPDGAKGDIEKRLIDAGLLKEKSEGKGGLWMFVLLALLVAAPLIILLKKNHKQVNQVAEQAMVKDSGNAYVKGSENKNIIYKEGEKTIAGENKKEEEIAKVDANSNVNIAAESKTGAREKKKSKVQNGKGETSSLTSVTASSSENRKAKREKKKKRIENETNALYAENMKAEKKKTSVDFSIPAVESKEAVKKNEESKTDTTNNNSGLNGTVEPTVLTKGNNLTVGDTTSETKQQADSVTRDTLAMVKSKPIADTTNKQLPPKEKKKKHIALDFSGAPQFNSIKYGNGIVQYQTYLEEARQSEKETPSFSAAFGIVLSIDKLVLETGLRHSVLASDFSITQDYTKIDTSQSHADTSGQWMHIENLKTGQTRYIATNTISFLEFPVLAGYRFQAHKFEIEIKVGPLMSFVRSANTTIVSLNTGNVVKYDELSNSPYRKTCWSLLGAANVLYPLGERILVFVQPSVKYGLNSIFKNDYPVTKKIQSYTAALGIRVKL